jgi:LacI family transcriptional regulator
MMHSKFQPQFIMADAAPYRVAVLVDTSTTWGRAVLRGINTYRLKHGKWEIFVEARGLEERLSVPKGWRGHGIIARVGSDQMASELRSLRIPVVNVSAIEFKGPKFPRVTTDLKASAELAANHFLERGFQHFAYFGLIGLGYVTTHRKVFAEVVARKGGSFASLAVKPLSGAEPDWRLDLAALGAWIKGLPKPVAIVCWNASSAREIVFACHEAGLLVPEEVSVLSQADDEALCETAVVPISGISVSGEGIGHRAAELLVSLMNGKRAMAETTLVAPLGIVVRQSTETLAVRDPVLVKALSFMRQNAAQPIRVNDVSHHAGVSRRVLERRFAEVMRCSPADEIRRVHVDRATRLLVETDLPMAQVAEMSGFGSQAYFSDIFRRQFGFTPLQYRKKNRSTSRSFS